MLREIARVPDRNSNLDGHLMDSEIRQRSPRAPLSASGFEKEKNEGQGAPFEARGANTSSLEKGAMPRHAGGSARSLGSSAPRSGNLSAHERQQQTWHGASPSQRQQVDSSAAATTAAAGAGADAQGSCTSGDSWIGPNGEGQYMCPWPKCDALCRSKRDRMVHLRAHRRHSRSCIRYDDSAAKDVPPALLCPISNKLMFEAVISAYDGHTYNRSALEARLGHGSLPYHSAAYRDRSPSMSRSISSSGGYGGGYGGDESRGRRDELGRDRSRDRDLGGGRSGGDGRNSDGHNLAMKHAKGSSSSSSAPSQHDSSSSRRGGSGSSRFSEGPHHGGSAAPALVPNWAVRRLLHEWCRCVGLEPPPSTAPDRFPPHALLPHDKASSSFGAAAVAAAKSDAQSAAESLGAALAAVSTTTSPRRAKKGGAGAAATTSSAGAMDGSSSDESDEEDFAPGALPPTSSSKDPEGKWAIRSPAGTLAPEAPSSSSLASSSSSSSCSSSATGVSGTGAPTGGRRKRKSAAAAAAAPPPVPVSTALGPDGIRVKRRPGHGVATTALPPAELAAFYGIAPPPPPPSSQDVEEPKNENSGKKGSSSSRKGANSSSVKDGKNKEDQATASKKGRLSSEGTDVYLVDRILDARTLASNKREYLVKWEGYDDPKDNTWEPASNILCENLVEQFEADLKEGKTKGKRKSKGTVSDDDDDDEDYEEGGDNEGKANGHAQKSSRARANQLKDSSDEDDEDDEDFASMDGKGRDTKNVNKQGSNGETSAEAGNEDKPKQLPPPRAPNLIPLKKKVLRPPPSVVSSSSSSSSSISGGAGHEGAAGRQGGTHTTDAGAAAHPAPPLSSSSLVAAISSSIPSSSSSSSRHGPGAGNASGFSSSNQSSSSHHQQVGNGRSNGEHAAGIPPSSVTSSKPLPSLTPLSPASSSADPSVVASNVSKLGKQRRLLSAAVRAGDVAAVESLLSAQGGGSSNGAEGGLASHVFADLAVELRESRIDQFLRREVCPWVNDLRECIDLNDRGVTSSLLLLGATNAKDATSTASSLDRIATLLRQILATWLEVSQGRAQHHQANSHPSSQRQSNNYSGDHRHRSNHPSSKDGTRHDNDHKASTKSGSSAGHSEDLLSRKGRPSSTYGNAGSSSSRRVSSSSHHSHPADRLADPFALPLPSPKTPSSSHGGGGGGGGSGFNGSHHGSSGGGGGGGGGLGSGGASNGNGASLASLAVRSGAPQEVTEMVEVDVAEEACATGHLEYVRAALVGESGKNMIHVKRASGVSALLKKSSLGLGSSSLHFVLRAKTTAEMAHGQALIRDLVDTVTANYHELVRSSSS